MMIVVIAAKAPYMEDQCMNARSDFKQALLTILALLVPVAIFVAAAPTEKATSLKPPDKDQIPMAFLISDGAVVIDFCGPWEVFQDVMLAGRQDMPFRLYTVAETKKPIRTSGGMQIVPDYAIADAPAPKVIVIPAQSDPSPAVVEWIKKSSK